MKNWIKSILLGVIPLIIWFAFSFSLCVVAPAKVAVAIMLIVLFTFLVLDIVMIHMRLTNPHVLVRPYDLFRYFTEKATTETKKELRDFYFDLALKAKSLHEVRSGKAMKIKEIQGKK